jgi:8-oxo-dGTP pyrophosphatase MutT (NUDIX family)
MRGMSRCSQLRNLLEELRPADEREAGHRARMLRLLDETAAPFSRAQYRPGHITASAFIMDPARQALLLILHAKLGCWLQPGGHIEDEDSDALAAVRREVLEETGVDQLQLFRPGVFDVDVHVIPARPDQPAHEHFDVRFLFSAGGAPLRAGSDANDARWVTIAELTRGNVSLPTDESVMRAVRKLEQAR